MEKRPQGWASLTRTLRDGAASSSLHDDPFPSLRGAGESGNGGAGEGGRIGLSSAQAPFVSVVSKGLLSTTVSLSQLDVVVARLREQHGWADHVLVRDILRAVDGDEEMAGAQLYIMAGPESPRAGGGGGFECGHAFSSGSVVADGAVECESNDVYLKFRREALRKSRARGKYARGAYNAYMAGDHTQAKQLSREARENWKSAEKLHAQAAEEILHSRIADGHADVWSLDLHGLHAIEAVMALEQRLAYLEDELTKNPALIYGHSQWPPDRFSEGKGEGPGVKGQHDGEHEQPFPLAGPRAVERKKLSVITGVGRHSKGGPSLPLAVQNFLLAHGYKFSALRPGVVDVSPKRHYT